MNCDHVQEKLSAFLDREEAADDFDGVLTHLYGCESCQSFFGTAVKIRSLAGDDRTTFPVEVDEPVLKSLKKARSANPLSYRLRLPVYVVSAAAVVLLAVSFMFGFMMQQDIYQKRIDAIMQAPPAQVVYGMPAQLVYPAAIRETKGNVR